MSKVKKVVQRAKLAPMPKVVSPLKGTKTATINLRIAPATKARAEKVFAQLGFGMSDGIAMFLQAVIHHKGIPFELRVPNTTTRKAIRELQTNKKLKTYDTTAEMFADILK